MINTLLEHAGAPKMFADTVGSDSVPTLGSIRADTFYGKVMTTATREYLEMRRAANLGPAKPREIFEALRAGGFKFEVKDENNAIIGIRAILRKNSSIFHRLPNNEYGLLAWYPRAKAPKEDDDVPEKEVAPARKTSAASKKLRKPRAASRAKRGSKQPPERKEEPDAVHQPDVTGPVTGDRAA